MQNRIFKVLVLLFFPLILFGQTPTFKEKIINWSKYVTWNIDRTKLYEAFTTVNSELHDYFLNEYSQKIYQEGNSRVELFKKVHSNNKKLIIIANGGSFINYYNERRKIFFIKHILTKLDNYDMMFVDLRTGYANNFPSENEDYIDAYKIAIKLGYNPSNIVFMGDSSGGNIVVSSTIYLNDNDLPMPRAIVLLSPYLDATNVVESRERNRIKDPLFGSFKENGGIKFEKNMPYFIYIKDKSNRYVSPIYANNLKRFPDILIHVGSNEILEDDSIIFAEKLRKSGVNVSLHDFEEQFHVFHIAETDMSIIALKEIVTYIKNLAEIEGVRVSVSTLNKIKFDVKLNEYTDEEVEEIFKNSGIDIENSKYIENKNLKKSNRKYILKLKKT